MQQNTRVDAAVDLVARHCDIRQRLELVPPSARVRGLYLRALPMLTAGGGRDGLYKEFFPGERWSVVRLYPLKDYMIRLAVAGASLRSPEHLADGMHEVWRTHAQVFAASLVGRVMLRLLSKDPLRLAEQGLAARRQTFFYGRWRIVRHALRKIEMVYEEEYLWIESAIAGGAVGTFQSCGLEVQLKTQLIDRFNGSTLITW